ncbi:MAG TPA: pyridine nucleotide-disulfide oxidoreductase, partial [Thermoanaerobaculia bacterium]|nr:pyridine nucleotide-disulfide oxidoreductase [Thermoanaerobaculia bacterium]
MKLGIDGFHYRDLYDHQRLGDLTIAFDRYVERNDAPLFGRFDSYRFAMQSGIAHGGLNEPEESALLIDLSRHLAAFLGQLFHTDQAAVKSRTGRDNQVARFKKEFVAKRVAKVQNVAADPDRLGPAVDALIRTVAGAQERDFEYALSVTANRLLDFEREYPRGATRAATPSEQTRAALDQLRDALRLSGAAFPEIVTHAERADSPEALGREAAAVHALIDLLVDWTAAEWKSGNFKNWTSFRLPKPVAFDKLVDTVPADNLRVVGREEHYRRRDGFKLTDNRYTTREVTDEANYCIFCHERKKDSCNHGFVEKEGKYKPNPLGVPLNGCPLDERIGEMNVLRAEGDAIAGLAMVMIDNPMVPGTGHRICNDCMKACIYQKQDPVNIPQIETGMLTDVLFIPYGFEIYSLLTRWNPLNVRRPIALPY